MKDFYRQYDEFTEEMVRYFSDHKEYDDDLLWLRDHPQKHRKFVSDLFLSWIQDPDHLDWYVANLISRIGRG